MDIEDLTSIESKLKAIVSSFPQLDSIFIIFGKMSMNFFNDLSTTTSEEIISEVTTNLTAPLLIARTMIPHFLSLKRQTTFITTSSGLAFIPQPMYPVYQATKSGIHQF